MSRLLEALTDEITRAKAHVVALRSAGRRLARWRRPPSCRCARGGNPSTCECRDWPDETARRLIRANETIKDITITGANGRQIAQWIDHTRNPFEPSPAFLQPGASIVIRVNGVEVATFSIPTKDTEL